MARNMPWSLPCLSKIHGPELRHRLLTSRQSRKHKFDELAIVSELHLENQCFTRICDMASELTEQVLVAVADGDHLPTVGLQRQKGAGARSERSSRALHFA